MSARRAASLRDRARGFLDFANTHEARGNDAAVAEAGTDLDRVLSELEQVDGVRPRDVVFGSLSDLGVTPCRPHVVRQLKARLAQQLKKRRGRP